MWKSLYYASRYWAARYWRGPGGVVIPPEPEPESAASFGELVSVPGVEVFEDFGILCPVYKDTGNLRIEYARRGETLGNRQGFEIPDRYVKYVRWYALWQALRQEGDGQDLELAEHFKQRWEAGVARMNRRKQVIQVQRKYIMGSRARKSTAPPKPVFGWPYPD